MKNSCPKNRFWFFFIKNYRVTYLLIVAFIIFGTLAIIQIPKESAPEVNIPVIVVVTGLPGSSAESVENLVTRAIENRISGLSYVTRITSTSEQGLSTVVVEMEPRVDASLKITEIRNRVDRARADLPSEAGNPTIQQISFSDIPIMSLALSGPYQPADLKSYAEELKDEIETIRDVFSVNITGAPDPEIRVELKRESLSRLNISADQVIRAISQANLEAPIGTIETGGGVYALRFDASLGSVEDIERVPVIERSGAVITVGDLAVVERGFQDQGTVSRFSSNGMEPQPTVSLSVFKESGRGNILSISDSVMNRINRLSLTSFPEDIEVVVVQNDADLIRSDLNTLLKGGTATVVIILLILSLFLGWRQAILASVVVPLSFLITFIVIDAWGLTINFLTLFSLILALGILVDAAIVVTESISTKYAKNRNITDSVAQTINDFQKPLMAGTLTTVFVFAPILLLSGIISEFIRSIPITVSAVLLSSLFVALGIISTISVRFIKRIPASSQGGLFSLGRRLDDLSVSYKSFLSSLIKNRRRSYLLMVTMFFAFLISISLPFIGLLPVNMFPSPDADRVFIDLEARPGTPLERTLETLATVESRLLRDPCVDSFLSVAGQGSQAGSIDIVQASNSHLAGLTVNLCENRKKTSQEFVSLYRSELADIPGVTVRITQPEEGPPTGEASITVNVLGADLDVIENYARLLAGTLKEIEGISEVSDGIRETGGEFVLTIDRNSAEFYGVTAAQVADVLRTSVSGRVVTDIKIGEDDIDILVIEKFNSETGSLGLASRLDIDDIRSVMILTSSGPVSLDNFVNVSLEPGRSSINRRDGERVISVTGQVLSGYNPSALTSEFRERIAELDIPPGVSIDFGGEAEEIADAFLELGKAMLLGILLIFALLVLQFNSFSQPLIVLTTVPLALIGVLVGLTVVGQPLSFPGAVGIVALGGIVVNNAIILIDKINRTYEGKEVSELVRSVVDGAGSRLKPVVLTTLTTSSGLVPLIFVSPSWAPVAYSIIFGLLFSTIITLFLIPVMYALFTKKRKDLFSVE